MVSHLFRVPRRLRTCRTRAIRLRQRLQAAAERAAHAAPLPRSLISRRRADAAGQPPAMAAIPAYFAGWRRASAGDTRRASRLVHKVRSARARAVRWQRQRAVHCQRQRGVALVVALVVLAAVLALAVVAALAAVSGERAARYERDHAIALAAAEAALHDAQRDIEGGADPLSARAVFFSGAAGFVEGCGRAADVNAGLCADAALHPAWELVDLSDDSQDAHSVAYGAFTGAALPSGAETLPCCLPRYVIEPVSIAHAGESAGRGAGPAYRITAIGFGTQRATQVVLQAIYRRVGP